MKKVSAFDIGVAVAMEKIALTGKAALMGAAGGAVIGAAPGAAGGALAAEKGKRGIGALKGAAGGALAGAALGGATSGYTMHKIKKGMKAAGMTADEFAKATRNFAEQARNAM